jgi:hypothetical protein
MQPSKASVASACEGEDRSCAGEGAGGGGPGGGGSCGAEAQRPGGRKRRSGRQGKERPERHGTPGLHLVAGAVAPPPPRCLLAAAPAWQGMTEERHLPPLVDLACLSVQIDILPLRVPVRSPAARSGGGVARFDGGAARIRRRCSSIGGGGARIRRLQKSIWWQRSLNRRAGGSSLSFPNTCAGADKDGLLSQRGAAPLCRV